MFGRRRHERAVAAARAEIEKALAQHAAVAANGLAELTAEYEARASQLRREHEAKWDAVASGLSAGDPATIGAFAGMVLQTSPAMSGFLEGGRATYDADARELVLEIHIPDAEVLTEEPGWKYIANRKAVEPERWRAAEARDTYVRFVAQTILAAVDALFRGFPTETVDVISVNGHVRTINPATGRPHDPCIVTVTTDRATFENDLDLQQPRLDAKACLSKLGAVISPNPYTLEHVEPMVKFDLTKYRIAHGPEALVEIDHRADLLKMNAYEFEKLVSRLFTSMGYETWRTESCRDDGIDAVATKPDPVMPVECIIQAKRFKGVVAPKEVQALMGALAEKPTATHGILVTTSWLSPKSRQRARAQRIHTIERSELATLIKEHLGIEVVISNHEPAKQARKAAARALDRESG